jgi:hypothetical protein
MTLGEADLVELEQRLPPWTRELIECLSPRRRQAFVLREAGGFTFGEVAQRLGGVSSKRAQQLYRAAVRVLTGVARRSVLLELHAPDVVPAVPGAQERNVLDMPVEALNIGVRGWNGLENAGISTIGELVRKNEFDLLRINNLGRKTLRAISAALAGLGLHLGMDPRRETSAG